MFRICFALLFGLFLIYPQSVIVLAINGAELIRFHSLQDFMIVWILNFFWVYTLTTHVAIWLRNRTAEE
jgi:hypothetical protein